MLPSIPRMRKAGESLRSIARISELHEIVDDIYMCATEFMHQGRLLLDEDFVGKSLEVCLWCMLISNKSKTTGIWGCPTHELLFCRHLNY